MSSLCCALVLSTRPDVICGGAGEHGDVAETVAQTMPGAAAMWRGVEERRMRRAWHLLIVFTVGAVVLFGRLAWLAHRVSGQQEALRARHRVSQELWIPGRRGRIVAADGRVLAWSERHFRLCWRVPATLAEAMTARAECAQIQEIEPLLPAGATLSACLGQDVILDHDLALSEDVLQSVLTRAPATVSLHAYFIRRSLPGAPESALLGTVEIDGEHGLERGVSGLEKHYDHKLRGRLVCFRMIADGRRAMVMDEKGGGGRGNGEDVHLGKVSP